MDAAQRFIAERGYEDITIDDVASACGIGKGTMYHYFSGKTDLFINLEHMRFQAIGSAVDAAGIKGAENKLYFFVREWFKYVDADNVNFSRSWYHLSTDRKVPTKDGKTHVDLDIENICAYLDEGVANGEFVADMPTAVIAADIAFSMYGSAFHRCSSAMEFDFLRWGDRFIERALNMHIAPFRAVKN